MARPIARDAEDFARLMLQTLEPQGAGRVWHSVRELFEQAAARHPEHAYLGHVAARPARRSALNATLERLRAAEFPEIERRREGGRRNAALCYRRTRPTAAAELQPPVSLDLELPYETPASHPLRSARGGAAGGGEPPASARRAALTERPPNSPWRRRLLVRRLPLPRGDLEQAWSTLRACWHRLRATVARLATSAGSR